MRICRIRFVALFFEQGDGLKDIEFLSLYLLVKLHYYPLLIKKSVRRRVYRRQLSLPRFLTLSLSLFCELVRSRARIFHGAFARRVNGAAYTYYAFDITAVLFFYSFSCADLDVAPNSRRAYRNKLSKTRFE